MTIKDLLEDLLIEYDELGMEPTTVVPNPSERAMVWKRELTCALRHLRAEVAREIFEEIEKIIKSPRTVGFCMTAPSFRQAISDYNEGIRKEILYYIAELKKKYTEPEPPKGD